MLVYGDARTRFGELRAHDDDCVTLAMRFVHGGRVRTQDGWFDGACLTDDVAARWRRTTEIGS